MRHRSCSGLRGWVLTNPPSHVMKKLPQKVGKLAHSLKRLESNTAKKYLCMCFMLPEKYLNS